MNIEAEVQEAINKNLPSAVGDVLKKRLQQADSDAALVKDYSAQLQGTRGEIVKLSKQLQEHDAITDRERKVCLRELEASKREGHLALRDLEVRLLTERLNDMKGLVTAVFQNNRFKYQVIGSDALPAQPGQYGTQSGPMSRDITGEG